MNRSSSSSPSSSFSSSKITLPVRDYDLAATLDSGQVFRWRQIENSWIGIVGKNPVRLTQTENQIVAETFAPQTNWDWLHDFLQTEIDLAAVLATFPDDDPMRRAVAACHGLRILRQEPWECLASFILSSTKQIVQIRQIVSNLCECFGEPLTLPLSLKEGGQSSDNPFFSKDRSPNSAVDFSKRLQAIPPLPEGEGRGEGKKTSIFSTTPNLFNSFPSPQKIASLSESQLRDCKMGFRAPNLLAAARHIAEGELDLESLRHRPYADAKIELMKLRGVGVKIADCVFLFAYGFDSAFPVDVWVERALQQLYFPRRRVGEKKLLHFAATHFGPHAGYAQQYLFHYMRTKMK